MKKLVLLSILLIPFVGFAQQKTELFENVNDSIFQMHKQFLLDGEPDFCFMVIDSDSAEGVSLSADGDSITYRYRLKPFTTFQQRLNEVREKGEEGPIPCPLDAKMKINSPKDTEAFMEFLSYIINDAKPFKFTPITDGFNCYVCANGKWANISDGEYGTDGPAREIIELVLIACQENDPSFLTEALH